MAKYKAERMIIKIYPSLALVFYDERTIYMLPDDDARTYQFHNYYPPRFNYQDCWMPFKKALLRRRYLDKSTCFALAAEHNVLYQTITREIKLAGAQVDLRYKRWTVKGTLWDVETKNLKE